MSFRSLLNSTKVCFRSPKVRNFIRFSPKVSSNPTLLFIYLGFFSIAGFGSAPTDMDQETDHNPPR